MRYPEFVKKGDTIGVPAPSNGNYPDDTMRHLLAEKKFQQLGFQIVLSKHANNSEKFVSASAKDRAEELMQLWEDQSISGLISLAGGEFMTEILPFLNEHRMASAKPKFFQGFSDNTILCHVLLTWLDTASIYHYNFKYFAQKKWHESVKDSFACLTGKKLKFHSFKKYQKERDKTAATDAGFDLTEPVCWNTARQEKQLAMQGRMIGGCIDVLLMFLGTKYDKTKAFLEKYKQDGFIWFLESFDLTVPEMKRAMWQLKENGWFAYAKGFVFGRPTVNETVNGLTYEDAVMEIIADLNVPVVFGADIGHKPPTIPVLVGAKAEIFVKNTKASVSYTLN